MIKSKRVILFGLESTENFDPGLTASNAVLVSEPQTNYGEGLRMHERNVVKPTFGKLQAVNGGSLGSISFSVPIKGIDASPGTAIEASAILQAIGFDETLNAGTSSVYVGPITNSIPSATIYDYHDGTLTILTGCRPTTAKFLGETLGMLQVTFVGHMVQWSTAQAGGASTITLDANSSAVDDTGIGQSITIIRGTGEGQTRIISDYVGSTKVATVSVAWVTPPDSTSVYSIDGSMIDVALPSPSYEATIEAPVKRANCTIGGYGPIISKFEIDLAYETAMNPNVNAPDGFAHPQITGIEVTGTYDPDKTLVATKDWLEEFRTGVVQAFNTGVIGETAGNQWSLAMANTYNHAPPENGDANNVSKFNMAFTALESSGDDRITLTFT